MRNILQIALSRPYSLWQYFIRTIGFALNFLILNVQNRTQPNFRIGANPRVLSFNAFKAEIPGARITVGDSIIVYRNCEMLASGAGQITFGNDCIIGSDFRMYSRDRITVGDHVLISWNVFISDYDAHSIFPDRRMAEIDYIQETFLPNFQRSRRSREIRNHHLSYITKPVIIGNNVWIGANVIILKGVAIGSGSVIAAGSVVTHDIPENCVAAGNPARVVKQIGAVS